MNYGFRKVLVPCFPSIYLRLILQNLCEGVARSKVNYVLFATLTRIKRFFRRRIVCRIINYKPQSSGSLNS